MAARLRADGALDVGPVVPTNRAALSWYKVWEDRQLAAGDTPPATGPAVSARSDAAVPTAAPADPAPAPAAPDSLTTPAGAPSELPVASAPAADAEPATATEELAAGQPAAADPAPAPAVVRFRPQSQADLAPAGETSKVRANLRALEVLAVLRAEDRPATAAEQSELARWSSWGAAEVVFRPNPPRLVAEAARLRTLLSEEEWRLARGTTPNAHYTDAALVQAGWDLLAGLGFTGGRVLEPGCGSGNWIGFAPRGVDMVGVELDPTTAEIAAALYPDADIRAEGFERSRFDDGSFDAVVGNVPFGNYPAYDPVHNPDLKLSLHNLFLLKSMRAVKPGGLVVAITSTWTMDAVDPAARRAIQSEGDLLGAIRLPSGAHQAAAGTSVATDLLVFRRRREGETPAPFGWEFAVEVELPEASRDNVPDDVPRSDAGVPLARINQWFVDNPDAMLGRLSLGGARNASDVRVVADRDTWPDALSVQARALISRAEQTHGSAGPVAWPGPPEPPAVPTVEELGAAREAGSLAVDADGALVRLRPDGTGKPVATASRAEERELRALVELLADTRAVLAAQADADHGEEMWRAAQARLDNHYDAYVTAFGRLSDTTTVADGVDPDSGKPQTARVPRVPRPILTDPGWGWLAGLEIVDPTSKAVTKAAIFTERVISPHRIPTGADTPGEALAASLAVHGGVDLDYIAALLRVDADTAEEQLGDLVYRDPVSGDVDTAAMYLSGNVRAKLVDARDAATRDPVWARNVTALEAVQPEDLTPVEIGVQLGAPWIPAGDIRDFIADLLEVARTDVTVTHSPQTASWKVQAPSTLAARTDWGTDRANARRLLDNALNQTPTKIYDLVDDGDRERQVLNAAETSAAQDKRNAIQERFADWLWEDPKRATRLARVYNDQFNNLRLPEFDGSHLTFPGMAAGFIPHQHQRDAVWRIVSGGMPGTDRNSLVGHVVGAGKTGTGVGAGMEMRRLGLVNKPMYVVPNHMLEQFAREFVQLYPLAKVLIATKADFAAGARQAFAARCATGNWDAVVITHSSFKRLPVSPEAEAKYIEGQIAEFTAAAVAAHAEDPDGFTVKELEKRIKRFEARQEVLAAERDAARDHGDVYFDDLGVDFIFGDEAHVWKGLPVASKLPTGISPSATGADMGMKLDLLRERHGDQIVCFLTGTPIANSLSEMWVLARNLSPTSLRAAGVYEFDAWAGTYARAVTALEMAPEGGRFRMVTRIAAFANVPELVTQFRAFADIKSADDLHLPRPDLVGGARETIVLPPSAGLLDYIAELGQRSDAVRAKTVDPETDNMLKVSTDGRKASLDLRLVGREPDPTGGKAERVAVEVAAIWKEHKDLRYLTDPKNPGAGYDKLPGAFQAVFCDLGTPGAKKRTKTAAAQEHGEFVFYDEVRTRLVAHGVPAGQIAYIHDAKSDTAKAKLFERCRNGQIAVLLGSTEKMGTGTNIQKRLVALHHVDVPWRPMDIEQRDGRILRQGNLNPEVRIVRYLSEGSFDAFMAQTVERKARFIGQVMAGDRSIRVVDDFGSAQALDAAQVKAIATGNPAIIRLAELEEQISRLRRQRAAHEREQNRLADVLTNAERRSAALEGRLATVAGLLPHRRDTRGEKFRATIGGRAYTDREAAGLALITAIRAVRQSRETPVGELGGLTVYATRIYSGRHYLWVEGLTYDEGRNLGTDIRPAVVGPVPLMSGLEQQVRTLDVQHARLTSDRARADADAEAARSRLGRTWPGGEELSAAVAERTALAASLTATDNPDQADRRTVELARDGDQFTLRIDGTPVATTRLDRQAGGVNPLGDRWIALHTGVTAPAGQWTRVSPELARIEVPALDLTSDDLRIHVLTSTDGQTWTLRHVETEQAGQDHTQLSARHLHHAAGAAQAAGIGAEARPLYRVEISTRTGPATSTVLSVHDHDLRTGPPPATLAAGPAAAAGPDGDSTAEPPTASPAGAEPTPQAGPRINVRMIRTGEIITLYVDGLRRAQARFDPATPTQENRALLDQWIGLHTGIDAGVDAGWTSRNGTDLRLEVPPPPVDPQTPRFRLEILTSDDGRVWTLRRITPAGSLSVFEPGSIAAHATRSALVADTTAGVDADDRRFYRCDVISPDRLVLASHERDRRTEPPPAPAETAAALTAGAEQADPPAENAPPDRAVIDLTREGETYTLTRGGEQIAQVRIAAAATSTTGPLLQKWIFIHTGVNAPGSEWARIAPNRRRFEGAPTPPGGPARFQILISTDGEQTWALRRVAFVPPLTPAEPYAQRIAAELALSDRDHGLVSDGERPRYRCEIYAPDRTLIACHHYPEAAPEPSPPARPRSLHSAAFPTGPGTAPHPPAPAPAPAVVHPLRPPPAPGR